MIKKVILSALLGVMSLMFVSGTALARSRNASDYQTDVTNMTFVFKQSGTKYNDGYIARRNLNNISNYTFNASHLFRISGSSDAQIGKVVQDLLKTIYYKGNSFISANPSGGIYRIIIHKYDDTSYKDIVSLVFSKDGCSAGYLKDGKNGSGTCKKMEPDFSITHDFVVNNIPDEFSYDEEED